MCELIWRAKAGICGSLVAKRNGICAPPAPPRQGTAVGLSAGEAAAYDAGVGATLTDVLAAAGFLSAAEEAALLEEAADGDPRVLDALTERRLTGEPLAWIIGHVEFCGLKVRVDPGVYVPRPQTEALAERAASVLPARGIAVDLCTGSGAIAALLGARKPAATVIGSDVDPCAVGCARRNGVDAAEGDLFAPLPDAVRGRVDVITAVVPYVPTEELAYLQRDTLQFESALAYDGGSDGTALLRRVIAGSPRWLRPGGTLLVEVGGRQDRLLAADMRAAGFASARPWLDEDGDLRALELTLAAR